MKKQSAIVFIVMLAAGLAQAATVTWDGETSRFWQIGTNWDTDTVPTDSDDVVIDTNGNFIGGKTLDINGVSRAGTVTIDPVWTGEGAGEFVLRVNSTFTVKKNITFTSNSTVEQGIKGSSTAANAMRMHDASIINNGTGQVVLSGVTAVKTLQIIGTDGDSTLTFGGSGNFKLAANLAIREDDLERVWTDSAFGGTLTLAGDTDFMDPATDIRVQGGTIKIESDEQIGANTQVSLVGGSGTLDAQGITETAGVLFNDNDGGTILVDTNTSLTFTDYRKLDAGEGDLDISGWSEGDSSLVFTDLGGTFYGGTIADDAAFVGLTIGGNTAYMQAIGGGVYKVTEGDAPTGPGVRLWMYRNQ